MVVNSTSQIYIANHSYTCHTWLPWANLVPFEAHALDAPHTRRTQRWFSWSQEGARFWILRAVFPSFNRCNYQPSFCWHAHRMLMGWPSTCEFLASNNQHMPDVYQNGRMSSLQSRVSCRLWAHQSFCFKQGLAGFVTLSFNIGAESKYWVSKVIRNKLQHTICIS